MSVTLTQASVRLCPLSEHKGGRKRTSILSAVFCTVSEHTCTLSAPPSRYAGSGVIRFLNYGRKGEMNGFVFESGIIALTPPMGTNEFSVVKVGASIAVSGFAHVTPGGQTVIEVQSITANGQTIAMNRGPRRGPNDGGPDPGPAGAGVRVPPAPPAAGAPSPPRER